MAAIYQDVHLDYYREALLINQRKKRREPNKEWQVKPVSAKFKVKMSGETFSDHVRAGL